MQERGLGFVMRAEGSKCRPNNGQHILFLTGMKGNWFVRSGMVILWGGTLFK